MSAMLYTVLPASGGFVNGVEVEIGDEVPLIEAEARYELALGAVAPTGREPVQPVIPVLLSGDTFATRRDARDRAVPVSSLELFLLRPGGLLGAGVDALGAAIRADLLGGAAPGADTLAKLAVSLSQAVEASARRDFSNLSDKAAARLNLGLGELATMNANDIVAAVVSAINGKEV